MLTLGCWGGGGAVDNNNIPLHVETTPTKQYEQQTGSLDVLDWSQELLTPLIGPFRAWKPTILMP